MATRTAGPATPAGDRCVCGVVHEEPIDLIVVDDDWLDRLSAFAQDRGGRGRLCSWTRIPRKWPDHASQRAVEGSHARHGALLSRTKRSACRRGERVGASKRRWPHRTIFSVGSGVITDLTRYVAARAGRQFVSVPTAASMDGYASGVAVMEFGGMKTSYPAGPPAAIFAEPRTTRQLLWT